MNITVKDPGNNKDNRLATEDDGATTAATATKVQGRRRLRTLLPIAIIVAAAVIGWPWLAERWSHIAINDARIAGNLVLLSSEVSGRIASISVIAGDHVSKGQLLASIDDEEVRFELEALDAQKKSIGAQKQQLRSQQAMIRKQVEVKLIAGRSQITAAEASHKASEAVLQNAHSRFERISTLAKRNISSTQSLEEAQADLSTAQSQEQATAAGIETATANLAVIRSQEAEIAVLDRQIASLDAQEAEIVAQRAQKEVELSRRQIHATFDGVVGNTFIEAGEYVSPGSRLLIYHDPETVWVDANVKETNFGQVKIGAPVKITVDAYPDIEFSGEVVRLGQAATSQFALLPSPNPSGNFTKITQRLPIRVAIEQRDGLLRPGMMVELSVDVID